MVVGRRSELELILAAVGSGRDLLIEGPPGTSKTTLLQAITSTWGIPLLTVEGNAELTPGRLLGYHDPVRVLREGYSAETFVPGPLVEAMQRGGFLYFEEFNRAPEDTLNTLLTAIADRSLTIPRVGQIKAEPTFRLVGSMNPFDNVGTTRLSVSIRDRLNRLEIDYQSASEEVQIVAERIGEGDGSSFVQVDAVAVTRATREHASITQGSSVRGAIDLAMIAEELIRIRGIERDDERCDAYIETFWSAMKLALSGRITLDPAEEKTVDQVLREIHGAHFAGSASGPQEESRIGAEELSSRETAHPGRDLADRAFRVKPKQLDASPELQSGGGGTGLAATRKKELHGRRGRGATTFSGETGAVDDEEGEPAAHHRLARMRSKQIAARLALTDPPMRARSRRERGELISLRYDDSGGEIDLDRTLEALTESATIEKESVFVRERHRTRRRLVLAVDASGSMRGDRLLTAAATVGALSGLLHRDELAVIAFWSDAAVLQRVGERVAPERIVDELLELDAAGLTNVSFPLEVATELLGGDGVLERRVILLSDCVHNAGPDPRLQAARLPRLDVLLDVAGERDSLLAKQLASAGRGALAPIRSHRDVAPAITRLFESSS